MGANGPWGICRTFLGGPQEVTHAFYFGCRVDFQEENFSLTTNWIWVFNVWSLPMMSYSGQHWTAMNISLGIKSWLHCGVDEAKLLIHEIISLSNLHMQLTSYDDAVISFWMCFFCFDVNEDYLKRPFHCKPKNGKNALLTYLARFPNPPASKSKWVGEPG